MKWNLILDKLGVPYVTNGKNSVTGACTIRCPICGDKPNNPNSKHGNLCADGSYKCWRCKGAAPAVVLSRITGIPTGTIDNMIKMAGGGKVETPVETKRATEISIPGTNNNILAEKGRKYLTNRGINPETVEFYYGVKYTDICTQNGQDWSHRIIIPVKDIYGNVVSYQGRDYTGKSDRRYLFPSKSNTIMDSKEVVYGADICTDCNRIVVLEGVFDVWKFGKGAVSTFGTSYTTKQATELSRWPEIVVCFDNEPEAQKHANDLAKELTSMGCKVVIACINLGFKENGDARDIGDATPEEVAEIRKSLGFL